MQEAQQAAAAAPAESAAPIEPATPASPLQPAPAETAEGAAVEDQPAPPADVHTAARQIAPDTFEEYDALAAHQDQLRQQIADGQAELARNAEAQAPNAAEIARLQERLQDTTPRLAKKYQARLAELTPDRDAFLADSDGMAMLKRDTPEITGAAAAAAGNRLPHARPGAGRDRGVPQGGRAVSGAGRAGGSGAWRGTAAGSW